MHVDEARRVFREGQRQLHAYRHAKALLTLDGATVAPAASARGRGETLAVLSAAERRLRTGRELVTAAETLLTSARDPVLVRAAEVFCREYEESARVPEERQVAYALLLNEADAVWHRAKAENDYPAFAPYIRRIFDALRENNALCHPGQDPYAVQLDRYERGLTPEKARAFFDASERRLRPLLHGVLAAEPPEDGFLWGHFPAWRQRRLTELMREELALPRDRCAVGETEHPFTTWLNRDDVRITTRYREQNFTQSLFSVIHESGHALYELGVDPALEGTGLDGGVSMGVHESQSRLYENMVGRSRAFLSRLLPRCRELFPGALEGVTEGDFCRAVNKVSPSLIRTEADELTYPFHVLLRFRLEEGLMAGTLRVEDLPELWRVGMRELLGIEVPDDRRGVLQDSHWSGGLVGYFPSYALGTAYAAQLWDRLTEDFDPEAAIARGELRDITRWLGEKLHRFGRLYDPEPLLQRIWGGPFDPEHYFRYLEQKYRALYGL